MPLSAPSLPHTHIARARYSNPCISHRQSPRPQVINDRNGTALTKSASPLTSNHLHRPINPDNISPHQSRDPKPLPLFIYPPASSTRLRLPSPARAAAMVDAVKVPPSSRPPGPTGPSEELTFCSAGQPWSVLSCPPSLSSCMYWPSNS